MHTVGGTRHKLSMIASVNNPGKARWMMIETAFDAAAFIEFLEGLIKDAGHGGERKLHVIMDKLRVHHSKIVKAWLSASANKGEVTYSNQGSYARDQSTTRARDSQLP